MSVQLNGQLAGSVSGAPQDVRLAFEGSGSMRQIEIKSLQASSGKASAQVAARLTRQSGQRWQLVSQGELQAFEPLAWFPGPELAAWGKGPHRFSGRWTVDLSAPQTIAEMPMARALPALLGEAQVRIVDSVVAGLPFSANLQLRQNLRAPTGQRAVATGDARLASTRVSFDGSADPTGSGTEDRTQLRLDMPSLQELAPLAAQVAALQAWSPRRGELSLQAAVRGRWPAIGGELQLRARDVEAGAFSMRSADAQGRFDARQGDEIALRLEAAAIAMNDARIDAVKADLQGTLANHRFEADVAAPLQPPQALAQALGRRQGSGAQARLVGQGGWTRSPAGGGRWAGASSGSVPASATPPPPPSPTARGSMRKTCVASRTSRPRAPWDRWSCSRTRTERPDRAALERGALRGTGRRAAGARLQGQIEPVLLAPVLQNALRGTLRWSGDLRVGAALAIRAAERFEADIRVLGEGGDLSFSEGGRPQPLGIREAELRLTARDGTWRFAPRMVGDMLGRVGGDVTVRTAPADRWPAPQAPIDGQLEASVPSLAALGGWLPPGWRLLGELQAQAKLSALRQPGYTGFVSADRVALRNLLIGVDLSEGKLRLSLDGRIRTRRGLQPARRRRHVDGAGTGQLRRQARTAADGAGRQAARAQPRRPATCAQREGGPGCGGAAAAPDGRIVADSGLFDISRSDAPSLDDDIAVSRGGDEPAPVAPAQREPSPMMRNAQVALDIDLGEKLRLRGRGIDARLRAPCASARRAGASP